MPPTVSILVPCFNAAPVVAEAIRSALRQTCADVEVIAVDDGSTDGTAAVLGGLEGARVRVLRQSNRGAAAARNAAVAASTGAFLQFLDADDVLAPDKIARQLTVLTRDAGQYVASGEWARFVRDTSDAVFVPEPVWADLSPVSWLCASWSGGGMMHPAAWLVPREVAKRAGAWDESLSLNDDGEYFSRVLLASDGVRFCQGARVYYRSGHPGSLSASTSRRAWESGWRAAKASTDRLLAAETSDRTRRACADAWQRYAYDAYADAPDLAEQAAGRALALGGAGIAAPGGPWFQRISRTLGWRAALRVRSAARRRPARGVS